jgi:hypothetical protein
MVTWVDAMATSVDEIVTPVVFDGDAGRSRRYAEEIADPARRVG